MKSFQISTAVDLIIFNCKLITILTSVSHACRGYCTTVSLETRLLTIFKSNKFFPFPKENENVYVISSLEMSAFFIIWHYIKTLPWSWWLPPLEFETKDSFPLLKNILKKNRLISKNVMEKKFKIHLNHNWDSSLMFSDARINVRFGVMTLNVARFS